MSIRASNWAWETARLLRLSQGEVLVLVRVADYADNEGICWPGIGGPDAKRPGIADYTCMDESTVRRNLKRLEGRGLLHREHRLRKHGRGRERDTICLHLDQPGESHGRSGGEQPGTAPAKSESTNRANRTVEAEGPTGRSDPDQPGIRDGAYIEKNHQGTVDVVDQRSTTSTAQPEVPDSVSSFFPHLNRVRGRKGVKALNLDAVVRACEKYDDRDLDLEAERFEHYWLEGMGENRPMRDVAAAWRNWLQTAPRMSKRGQIRAAERRQARDHRTTDPGKRALHERINRAREAAA